jgi:hypothetical protein
MRLRQTHHCIATLQRCWPMLPVAKMSYVDYLFLRLPPITRIFLLRVGADSISRTIVKENQISTQGLFFFLLVCLCIPVDVKVKNTFS